MESKYVSIYPILCYLSQYSFVKYWIEQIINRRNELDFLFISTESLRRHKYICCKYLMLPIHPPTILVEANVTSYFFGYSNIFVGRENLSKIKLVKKKVSQHPNHEHL